MIVALLLPLAAIGEKIGYRPVYQFGVAVFTLGSLACALSHTLELLVAARVLQGVGGAAIMSVNGALVRHTYPDTHLGRGVGLNGLVVAISAAVAPSLASGILAVGTWPWLSRSTYPSASSTSGSPPAAALRAADRPFEWTSALLSAAMFGLFFVGADTLTRGGAGPARDRGARYRRRRGVLLYRSAARRPAPLIPVDLFRIPVFSLSVTASICAFAAFSITFVALPFYFQSVLGRDQVATGLLMTPWPVALGLAAPIAGRLSDRAAGGDARRHRHGGGGARARAAQPALAGVTSLEIALMMALGGFGFGFFQAPNNRTLLAAAPRAPLGCRRRDARRGAAPRDDGRRDRGGARLPSRAGPRRAGRPADRDRLRDRRRDHQPAAGVEGGPSGPGRRRLRSAPSACWQGR